MAALQGIHPSRLEALDALPRTNELNRPLWFVSLPGEETEWDELYARGNIPHPDPEILGGYAYPPEHLRPPQHPNAVPYVVVVDADFQQRILAAGLFERLWGYNFAHRPIIYPPEEYHQPVPRILPRWVVAIEPETHILMEAWHPGTSSARRIPWIWI